jgi:predicted DNA-binding transcriptional regulator AlpA
MQPTIRIRFRLEFYVPHDGAAMTASLKLSKMPGWPRAMRVQLAAAYVGMSPTHFLRLVNAGQIPKPFEQSPAVLTWLKDALDEYLDGKAGRDTGARSSNAQLLMTG